MAEEKDVWVEICVIASEEIAEGVADALRPFAEGESVAFEQLGDPADLDPQALLPEVYLKLYVNGRDDTPLLRQKIGEIAAAYDCVSPAFTVLAETDWANAWKENYRPFRLGPHFWIQPSWELATEAQADDTIITLDPGMAFGTGLHATTQLCFELLRDYLRPSQSLLDVGCGSGILSIAAAKLGAGQILAVDNDEAAVAATAANAALNQTDQQIDVQYGSLNVVEAKDWEVVVVNILAAIIMPMLQHEQLLTYAADGGYLIFSGIVEEQANQFIAVLNEAGGTVVSTARRDGWVAFVAQRK